VTAISTSELQRSELQRRAHELLRAHSAVSSQEFLGAQYDAGLAWVHFPVGSGGQGADPGDQAIVDEVLTAAGKVGSWQRNPMGIGMVAPALAVHGTARQRAMLRQIFTAEQIWCQLFSEPGAGSDVAGLATRAVAEGESWRLSGQKVWTSLAHAADYGLALARTDPNAPKHRGLTAFVIDMHAPGVTVRPLRDLTGASHFNEVFLDDVVVPDADRVGAVGDGWSVAITMLTNERSIIGTVTEQRGEGPIALAIEAWRKVAPQHADRRVELTRLWIDAEVLRLSSMSDLDPADGPGLKLRRGELDQRIAAFTMELLGPAGLRFEPDQPGVTTVAADGTEPISDPVRAWLQSQAYTIAGGTSDILRTIVGERVLGLPREPGLSSDTPWSQIPR
jgi:alkylation response protein AidB-like acyl-CoA dehydrogenase